MKTSRRSFLVIGIGAGSPDHLTLEAIQALRSADVVVSLDKGEDKADLLALRHAIVDKHAPGTPIVEVEDPPRDRTPDDYEAEVRRWHAARADRLAEAFGNADVIAFLVWGDPSLYDSTLRMLEHLGENEIRVVPGITSVQALTAAHRILLNEIGQPIQITTGRRLADATNPTANTVVMLDGGSAWQEIDDPDVYIWWGAYLSTPDEVLRSGYVAEIGAELAELKQELRAQHGWIMDTYLLRRVGP